MFFCRYVIYHSTLVCISIILIVLLTTLIITLLSTKKNYLDQLVSKNVQHIHIRILWTVSTQGKIKWFCSINVKSFVILDSILDSTFSFDDCGMPFVPEVLLSCLL